MSLNPCFGGIWSLRQQVAAQMSKILHVLILVLVGYGLWDLQHQIQRRPTPLVLILVLVGYGLWVLIQWNLQVKTLRSLNPCFGGIWSLSITSQAHLRQKSISLNPCFGGIWSLRALQLPSDSQWLVWILVLVGYGLWELTQQPPIAMRWKSLNPCFGGIWSLRHWRNFWNMKKVKIGLNPCFGGIWSLSFHRKQQHPDCQICLNPCFGGIWSLSQTFIQLGRHRRHGVLILVLVGYGLWVTS